MKVATADHNHAVGHTERVLFTMWRRDTTLDAVRALAPVTQQLSRLGTGSLTIVERGASLPSSKARTELASALRAERTMLCSALVFEGDGFRAAAVRAITTGIYQLAKPPFPIRVFANVMEAAEWMESFPLNVKASQVVASVNKLRSALDAL